MWIKKIEANLRDTNTVLNSFIVSNTRLGDINSLHSSLTYEFFEDKKYNHVGKMFDRVLSE